MYDCGVETQDGRTGVKMYTRHEIEAIRPLYESGASWREILAACPGRSRGGIYKLAEREKWRRATPSPGPDLREPRRMLPVMRDTGGGSWQMLCRLLLWGDGIARQVQPQYDRARLVEWACAVVRAERGR